MQDGTPLGPVGADGSVRTTEVRLLEGPNLYFSRPAVKVSLSLPGYQDVDAAAMRALAEGLGMARATPGKPHTGQRHRFLVRLTSALLRQIAARTGTRLGVRSRPGAASQDVVVAFPWRHRRRAQALGEAIGPALAALLAGADPEDLLASTACELQQVDRGGEPPLAVRPRIPVASVTGTNGKTSTTRLLAHMGMTCGVHTGWSSTEGVYVQGQEVVAGDYSGPAGARTVLADPQVQLGILETARGGLLLKGMGVLHNDVSVVTNVTADHLGLNGIDTVDQLAEVKGIITRVTRKGGWVVLNGDDPRARAMALHATGRIWMFSLDPDNPALREALDRGGRAITVLEGSMVVLRRDADPERLLRVRDVPMTLAGLSEHNTANALAATAAGLGLGLPRDGVVEALRTFTPDLQHNPGRMNVWTLPLVDGGQGSIIVDLAHNEAGLEALLTVADGLRLPGARVHLGLGGPGDRSDDILLGLGEIAGRRADRVQIAHKAHYLRGRTLADLEAQLVQGLANVGVVAAGTSPTEVEGLATLVESMADGDVVAFMCHAERADMVQWLEQHGATQDTARQVRRKAIAARGEHELESVLAANAQRPRQERLAAAQDLVDQAPQDPRLIFELASALEEDGQVSASAEQYRNALTRGLREPHRLQAQIRLAWGLRTTGDGTEAAELLTDLASARPDHAVVAVLQALVDVDDGRASDGVARLVDYVMQHTTGEESVGFREAMAQATAALRTRS